MVCQHCNKALGRASLNCPYREHELCPYKIQKTYPGLEILSLRYGLLLIVTAVSAYALIKLWPAFTKVSPPWAQTIEQLGPFIMCIVPIALFASAAMYLNNKVGGTFIFTLIMIFISSLILGSLIYPIMICLGGFVVYQWLHTDTILFDAQTGNRWQQKSLFGIPIREEINAAQPLALNLPYSPTYPASIAMLSSINPDKKTLDDFSQEQMNLISDNRPPVLVGALLSLLASQQVQVYESSQRILWFRQFHKQTKERIYLIAPGPKANDKSMNGLLERRLLQLVQDTPFGISIFKLVSNLFEKQTVSPSREIVRSVEEEALKRGLAEQLSTAELARRGLSRPSQIMVKLLGFHTATIKPEYRQALSQEADNINTIKRRLIKIAPGFFNQFNRDIRRAIKSRTRKSTHD